MNTKQPILNEDEHKDYSQWVSFFKDWVVFVNNTVLEQMIADIKHEQELRITEKTNEK